MPGPGRRGLLAPGRASVLPYSTCGVTWDAVPEQLWLLKLQRKPAFTMIEP